MSDPVRHKDLVELYIDAKAEGVNDPIRFTLLADKNVIENTPPDDLQKKLLTELNNLSLTPVTGIYKNYVSFSYEDPDALKDFDFANTLVQAHLPYCLHLPQHYEMTVSIPELDLTALVIFEKLWTSRAQVPEQKSGTTDFYADDRVLYFKSSTFLTPELPFRPEEGWDSYFTGRNIERLKDQNGVFRYTRVHIQFNTASPDDIERHDTEKLIASVQERALAIINRVIDNYRAVTKESHVRRLGHLKINLVYFIPQNIGFYVLLPYLQTAPMNRSRQEIEAISKALETGARPPVHNLLLLDAHSSLDTGDHTLAIVEAFQALDLHSAHLEGHLLIA